MFKLITTTAKLTNTSRILVNRVGKKQINLGKAPQIVKDFFENSTKNKEYSKNIFKRAWIWVKDFVENFKAITSAIKEQIEAKAKALGKKFTKQDAKTTRNDILAKGKETINKIKEEIDKLTKKAKTATTNKSKAKTNTTNTTKTTATPSFAGKNVSKIKLAELKEIAKTNGATEEMLNTAKTKAQVVEIIENLKANA